MGNGTLGVGTVKMGSVTIKDDSPVAGTWSAKAWYGSTSKSSGDKTVAANGGTSSWSVDEDNVYEVKVWFTPSGTTTTVNVVVEPDVGYFLTSVTATIASNGTISATKEEEQPSQTAGM